MERTFLSAHRHQFGTSESCVRERGWTMIEAEGLTYAYPGAEDPAVRSV